MPACDTRDEIPWVSFLISDDLKVPIYDGEIDLEPDQAGGSKIKGRHRKTGQPITDGVCDETVTPHTITFKRKEGRDIYTYTGEIVVVPATSGLNVIINGRYERNRVGAAVTVAAEDEGTWVGTKPIT